MALLILPAKKLYTSTSTSNFPHHAKKKTVGKWFLSALSPFAVPPTHGPFPSAENLSTPAPAPAAAMAASAPIHLLLSPSRSTWPPQDPSLRPIPPLHAWPARQRHLRAARCALSPPTPSLDLPLLPFQPAEVKIFSDTILVRLFRFQSKPKSLVCGCRLWCTLFREVDGLFHRVQSVSVGPWKMNHRTNHFCDGEPEFCIGCTAGCVSFAITEDLLLILTPFYGNHVGPIWSACPNAEWRCYSKVYKTKELH